MELKDIKSEINTLREQIEAHNKTLQSLFKENLIELLAKHSVLVESVYMGMNNHEFSDGDVTHFGLYYQDLNLYGPNGEEYGNYGNETNKDIVKEFVKFFESFDIDNFYETFMGDFYESVTFKIENGKLTIG